MTEPTSSPVAATTPDASRTGPSFASPASVASPASFASRAPGAPTLPAPSEAQRIRSGRMKALLVLLICAAPVIASYLTYYYFQPEGRTNYGELILPQRPVGALAGQALSDGAPRKLADFEGKWLMLMSEGGACEQACERRLYVSRQVRTTAGKDMDRIERVLLLTGSQTPAPALLEQHPGLRVLRLPAAAVAEALSMSATAASDHIFMIDPLGHLMMRFPADVDPSRMKKDLAKLLRASRVG